MDEENLSTWFQRATSYFHFSLSLKQAERI